MLGYLNWLRKRRAIHRADVLDSIVRDLTAQKFDHLAVTGDLVNIALAAEFKPAARGSSISAHPITSRSCPATTIFMCVRPPNNHSANGARICAVMS